MVQSKHLCTQRENRCVGRKDQAYVRQKPLVLQLLGWQQTLVMESLGSKGLSALPRSTCRLSLGCFHSHLQLSWAKVLCF